MAQADHHSGGSMTKIVISYRRKDALGITGRIFDRLKAQYGNDSVFMDEDIPDGADFLKHIKQALRRCDVFLAIIGPKWLGPGQKRGRFRISEDTDPVRIEIETALRRNIPIIPVLIDGASIPDPTHLPESLKDLVFRQAAKVDAGRDFDLLVARLIHSINRILESKRKTSTRSIVPARNQESTSVATSRTPVVPTDEARPRPIAPEPDDASSKAIAVASTTAPTELPATETSTPGNDSVERLAKDFSVKTRNIWVSRMEALVRKRLFLASTAAVCLILAILLLLSPFGPFEISKKPIALSPSNSIESSQPQQPVPPPTIAQRLDAPPVSDTKPAAATATVCGSVPADQSPAGAPIGGPLVPIAVKPILSGAQPLRAIAFSPDGTKFATAGDDGIVRLWDAAPLALAGQLRAHQGPAYSVAYWMDGSLLASAGWDGKVRTWNTSNGQSVHTFEAEVDKKPVKQFSVAFYPGKTLRYVDSAGADGSVWIWDVQQNSLKKRPSHEGADDPTVRSLSFAPNASGEFVSAGYDGTIKFFLETGKIESVEAHAGKVLRVAYAPDGRRVASAGVDKGLKNLRVWNAKSRSLFRTYEGHVDYVVSAAWSQDGRWLASGGGNKDTSIRLWDAETGKQLHRYVGHQKDVESLAFPPGGNRLVSVSEDKSIKLWDIESEKELLTIIPFEDGEYVAYMPNGCYTGSPGAHRHMKVVVDGVESDPTDQQKAALFVPNGFTFLATGR